MLSGLTYCTTDFGLMRGRHQAQFTGTGISEPGAHGPGRKAVRPVQAPNDAEAYGALEQQQSRPELPGTNRFEIARDCYVTRVGRVFLGTRLHRLPELFSVLRGEMSLVGPRPANLGSDTSHLWRTARLEVKPGITGLSQISRQTGLNRDERTRVDITYVRNRTIRLDITILLHTFGLIVTSGREWITHTLDSGLAVPPLRSTTSFSPLSSVGEGVRSLVSARRFRTAMLAVSDIAVAALAFVLAYLVRFELHVGVIEPVAKAPPIEYAKLFLVIGATIAILAHLQQLYRTANFYSTLEESYIIAKTITFATAIGLAIAFFYRDFQFSRLALAYFWTISIVLIATTHSVYRRWLIGRYARGLDRRRTIVVGEPSDCLLERLRSDAAFGVEVVGWLGCGADGGGTAGVDADCDRAGVLMQSAKVRGRFTPSTLPRLGTIDDAPSVVERGSVEQIIIVERALTHYQLLSIVDACERHCTEVQLIPPIYDLLVQPTDLAFVNGVPVMRIDEARYHRGQQAIKRAFDIVAAGILLLLLAPLTLTIAAAIRWTSPGPALFRQMRAGKGGSPFEMLKFRTMVCDAERRLAEMVDVDRLAEPVFKIVGDPRVTPVGRWLRRFSLDELPQLLNVLKGEMTLVGPRPEELKIADRYDVWQRRRLKIKPGITGLQQVEARGALSNLNERVRLDVYYTRKQSFSLDMAILLRTVGAVLSGRGAT